MTTKTRIFATLPFAALLVPALAAADVKQPQEIIDRPRTTPGGQITVEGDLGLLLYKDLMGDSANSLSLTVGGSYGVDDKIEVGASYGFALKEFEIKGAFLAHAAYSLIEGNLSVAADVGGGYDVLGETAAPIGLGARVQFKVNDKLAVYSPGQQITIGLSDPNPITLGLPVGVGYQASPALFAHVDTEIANISIKDSSTTVFGADYIPLAVGAYFSPSNTMDFGAAIHFFDLKNAGDLIGVVGTARLHM